jgi:DNA-directed RNA polymerase specialized sigma24 family protein
VTHDRLDQLLVDWLSERDRARAESKFSRYFQLAFPALCRYVRSFRVDATDAEEIAQRALIKLFEHLGPRRQAARERVRNAVELLRPLDFGAWHAWLVHAWRRRVRSVVDAPSGALPPAGSVADSGATEEWRHAINERIEALVQQGWQFVDELRRRTAGYLRAVGAARDSAPMPDGPADLEPAREFAATLLALARDDGEAAVDGQLRTIGAVRFVRCAGTACDDLPLLTFPSNGLLFTIARRQFLDRARALRAEARRLAELSVDALETSALEEIDLDLAAADRYTDPTPATEAVADTPADADIGNDSLHASYRAFMEFLRIPLTRAEAAVAEASQRGRASAERARMESLRAKYERLLAVLRALHESPQPSEADIAARLGLTRNQVKYAIERIRSEFTFFFPQLSASVRGRRKRPDADSR